MRALCSKGAKMPSKEKLMELFEALSGFEPEDGLRSDLHRMDALALGVRLRYLKMDRWARDVVLPCNWAMHGHYELRVEAGELRILHRRSGHEEAVSKKLLAAVRDLKGMIVERNWSERRAAVTDVNGAIKCLVLVACPSLMEYIEPFPAAEEIAKSLDLESEEKHVTEEVAAPPVAVAVAKRAVRPAVPAEASLVPPAPRASAADAGASDDDEDLYEGKEGDEPKSKKKSAAR